MQEDDIRNKGTGICSQSDRNLPCCLNLFQNYEVLHTDISFRNVMSSEMRNWTFALVSPIHAGNSRIPSAVQVYAYDYGKLLSDVGGLMGLFLGLSMFGISSSVLDLAHAVAEKCLGTRKKGAK